MGRDWVGAAMNSIDMMVRPDDMVGPVGQTSGPDQRPRSWPLKRNNRAGMERYDAYNKGERCVGA